MKTPLALFFCLTCILVYGQRPRLVVPVGHTDSIISIKTVTIDGQFYILTGGLDHYAKLWDMQGREIQSFLAYQFEKGFDISISTDGKYIITCTPNSSSLYDLGSPESEIQRFHPYYLSVDSAALEANKPGLEYKTHGDRFGHAIRSACFAQTDQGLHLLTLGTSPGMAILWNLNARVVQTFDGSSPANAVAFSSKGQSVLTGHYDGTARLWDLQGQVVQTFKKHTDAISCMAFSPDEQTILTGSSDSTAKLWDLKGRLLQTFQGHSGGITAVAFSHDGQYIQTMGEDNTSKWWNLHGDVIRTIHTSRAVFSPDGRYVFTANKYGMFDIWDREGQLIQSRHGHANWISSAAWSLDGRRALTGHGQKGRLWDLTSRKVWSFNGSVKEYSEFMTAPDGQRTQLINSDSSKIYWDLSHWDESRAPMSEMEGTTLAPDNRIVNKMLVPEGKWTKLWSLNPWDEASLATLFEIDSTDWVVTSPSGLFDASPGAMQLMHYTVGLEVIELEQLKERYYEPGLLSKIMGFSDEPLREVEGFDSVALYPSIRLQLDTLQNKLHIQLTPRNGGVGKVSVFINDKEIIEDANPLSRNFEKKRDTAITIELDKYACYFLLDSLNTVSIRAYNEAGWLKSAAQSVEYRPVFAKAKGDNNDLGANDGPSLKNRIPSLHILVVGSADYAGTDLDLQYAAKDARDMAGALEQIGRQLFIPLGGKVTVHLLTTDSSASDKIPTKANIKAAFEAIKKDDKAEDVVIVYFSGHGITYGDADRALFYYLTRDIGNFDLSDAGIREKRAISSDELTKWLNDTHARKQVLILDACNSGKVVEALATSKKELSGSQIRALDRMKDRTGMFVLAGSAANKVSYEAGQYGQGLLTYSLLQGIKGLAHPDDERVDVMKLFQYSCDEVPQLAKGIGGIQTPMLVGPLKGSFDIGIKNDSVHITIAEPKPVFIRNILTDEDTFDDVLGLTDALETYFRNITVKGAQADLIFVDVKEYENAYSVKGRYKINGENVVLRGRLFKGKTIVGNEFEVSGKKTNLPALAEAIYDKIMELLQN